ncbi:tRNA (adenosine(37)-N6)-threonylcarbamoyltransferase complex dimerization subunit type 1 TsaB [Acetivibrio straminisolvens]|jgi:tRNA threonylcarbamoyladenosine biosynthesis protein TsaB|uniref:Inactive homolog of metal-dependent proteases n=1 Tax=Acetivibrio straminisolvens JCM 21531 TaxID=1294263 RepID=W4VAN7_9FIRM|nr:tRNA (adenosine(37)-N6)-threonylcarbamoyltransferase complex dimerization subunit type 1 TsaB [Acetivibrio straminisolvens]GAE89819.1 inactive homolog of metal-dependent proteases [Acetivibrio straminisolvens JCM 21531]
MKILALDTSALVAAVAVMEDDRLLGEYMLNHRKTHSQQLIAMIREVLGSLELVPKDIDVFAASTGPGSFTGLRIGVTTVKAMAYAAGKPVVSVPTLDAIAYNIPISSFTICPVMDARNNQVYTALYDWDENGQKRITDYLGIPVSELVKLIKDMGKKVIFAGDAAKMHEEYFRQELGDDFKIAPGSLLLQRASSVAHIAYLKAMNNDLESCFDMVPFYLRKSQAEREYEKKLCKDC